MQAVANEPAATTVRTNFADSALWVGNVLVSEEGVVDVPFDMPENLTSVENSNVGNGCRNTRGRRNRKPRHPQKYHRSLASTTVLCRKRRSRSLCKRSQTNLTVAKEIKVVLELAGNTLKSLATINQNRQRQATRTSSR